VALAPAETLTELLDLQADAHAGDDALRWGTSALTYAELRRLVLRCAGALERAGVAAGDRVAMLAPPCWQQVVVFLGAAELGAIFVGLNPRHRLAEHDYVLHDARPVALFGCRGLTESDGRPVLEHLAGRHREIRLERLVDCGAPDDAEFTAFLDGEPPARRRTARPADPVAVVYTSGSTGKRKGALLTHRGLLTTFRAQVEAVPLTHPVNCLDDLPIDHLAGLVERVLPALLTGGHVVMHQRFDPQAFIRDAAAHRVNFLQAEVTQWLRCVAHPEFAAADLSCVEVALYTGAAAPPALLETLCARFPYVITAWGMSETHAGVTITGPLAPGAPPGIVGRVVPGAELRIAGDGEILVRGAVVFPGYLGRAPDEAGVDAEGWLHTGDIGALDAEGNLRLTGRSSDMFKSGGYNVYPREVEDILERHPAVTHAAVVPIPDPRYQEAGVAYVVASGAPAPDEAELVAHCRSELATYKVPRHVEVLPELPLLENGKVDRVSLRASARARYGSAGASTTASSS